MTEEKSSIKELGAQIKQIEEINHKIYCVNETLNLIYQAICDDAEHAVEYASGLDVCSWTLNNVQNNLDKIYEEALQILRDCEYQEANN